MPKRSPISYIFLLQIAVILLAASSASSTAQPTLSLQCKPDKTEVTVGETVRIEARGEGLQNLPLLYSFKTSAGSIEQKETVGILQTRGLSVLFPLTVKVECSVMDSQGRRASESVAIRVLAVGTSGFHGSGHPPPQPNEQKRPPAQVVVPQPTPAPVTGPPAPKPEPAPPPPPPVTATTPPTRPAPVESAAKQQSQPQKPKKEDHTPSRSSVSDENPPDAYPQSQSVRQWVEHLKQGKIEYKVPTRMTVQVASTVTVVIHGYEDVATTTLSGATGTGALKQSERMRVELLAPDNPGAFNIVAQDGDSVRFVPIDGTTTWMWTVSPNTAGNNLKLEVRAFVIYPPGSDKTEQQVETYDATVAVAVQPFWTTAAHYVREHPLQVLGYVIPGGAGFTFLAGLAAWWWKQRKEGTAKKTVFPLPRIRRQKRRP